MRHIQVFTLKMQNQSIEQKYKVSYEFKQTIPHPRPLVMGTDRVNHRMGGSKAFPDTKLKRPNSA